MNQEVLRTLENMKKRGFIVHTFDTPEEMGNFVVWAIGEGESVGFGGSVGLIFLAPLVLLFSYTRRPKNPMLDLLIPAAGIALILLAYLEGIHQLLGMLPIPKINLQELKGTVTMYMDQFTQ